MFKLRQTIRQLEQQIADLKTDLLIAKHENALLDSKAATLEIRLGVIQEARVDDEARAEDRMRQMLVARRKEISALKSFIEDCGLRGEWIRQSKENADG